MSYIYIFWLFFNHFVSNKFDIFFENDFFKIILKLI